MRGIRGIGLAVVLVLAAVVPAARAEDPVIVAAGDIACDPEDSAFNAGLGTSSPAPGSCHQKYTSDLIGPINPTHVLPLGDIQYEDGKLDRFENSYAPSWGRPLIKAKSKPVPGNHEYGRGNSPSNPPGTINVDPNATGYFTYFQTELAAEGPDAQNPQKGWYSFDVPVGGTSWHVVAMNSECAAGLRASVGWEGGCDVGSEQERWLRAHLAANQSDCTLAYWHHPRFSSGLNRDNPITAPLWNALYEDYADVVLAGHEHNYERFGEAGPTGAREPGRGIRSWVVGTGGKNQNAMQPSALPATDLRANTTHGVLKLTLHGPSVAHPRGWYEWEFVDDGQSGVQPLTDSSSGDCVGPSGAAPQGAGAAAGRTPPAARAADTVAPAISRPALSRTRFRVGRGATARFAATSRGTAIRYTLSEAATVSLRIERTTVVRRRGKRVKRYRRAGTLTRKGAAGRRRVAFSGRIARTALASGRYRLTLSARDAAGNVGAPRRLAFVVVK